MNADGTGQREVVVGGAPAWSPDGTSIAFVRAVNVGTHIFVVDADGSNERQLTNFPDVSEHYNRAVAPDWSPDGKLIAFAHVHDALLPPIDPPESTIYTIDIQTGTKNLVVETRGNGYPQWSPDGARILYEWERGGDHDLTGRQLWVVDADGANPREIAGGYSTNPRSPEWSPDGAWVALSQDAASQEDPSAPYQAAGLYLVSPDGRARTQLTHFGQAPAWSPNSQYIAYQVPGPINFSGPPFRIVIYHRSGGELVQLTDGGHSPQWRPGPAGPVSR
jgi:Tol biopolymer transport system component